MSTGNAKTRRPRRIATDEAHAWARNLTLGNPYAKAILMALGYYVNEDGTCFVSIGTLAQDTDLSDDTVRRRLRWLEQIGALAKSPRWRDENGRVNEDGKGKRTSDLIRLMLEADPDEIEGRAQGLADGRDIESTPSHGPGVNLPSESVTPAPALGQPPHCGQGVTSNFEQEDSPQSPPLGDEESKRPARQEVEDETALAASLEEFRRIYPTPANNPELVADLWRGLAAIERTQALHGARGTRAYRERNPKMAVVGPLKFLRSSALWAEFSRFAPAEKAPPPPRVFDAVASPQWNARAVIAAITGQKMPLPRPDEKTGERGASFLGELPHAALVLAQFADQFGEVDTKQWVQLDQSIRKQQIAAWVERIFECTGQRIAPGLITVGTTRYEICGKVYEDWPVKITGLLVPSQWPPAKGSPTVSAAMTTEDEKEFANST